MDPLLVTAEIEKTMVVIGDGENFMRDTVFSGRKEHDFKFINLAETSMNVRSLPYVGENDPGYVQKHADSTLEQVKTPKIDTRLVMNETNASEPMYAGSAFKAMGTDLSAAQVERILEEQAVQRRSFSATEEDACASIAQTGTYDFIDIKGNTRYDIDYGYVTSGAVADRNILDDTEGNELWDSPESDIIKQLGVMDTNSKRRSGNQAKRRIICGSGIEAVLRNNAKLAAQLDNRRMMVGGIDVTSESAYIGTIGRWDFFQYQRGVLDTQSNKTTQRELWPENRIMMIPENSGAMGMGVHYGGIWDAPFGMAGRWNKGRFFQKIVFTEDPKSTIYVLISRPLPVIKDPRAITVQDVYQVA